MPASARDGQQRMQTAMQTAARGDARAGGHRSALLGEEGIGARESKGVERDRPAKRTAGVRILTRTEQAWDGIDKERGHGRFGQHWS
jgi:hypothetical protein